jgi:hypothetical protein
VAPRGGVAFFGTRLALPSLHDVDIDVGRPHRTRRRRLIQRYLRLSRRRPASLPGRGPHREHRSARARRLPITTFKFFCSVSTAFSVDCYGSAKLSIRPATESTLVLFASADGATSKWVSSPKPLSASETLGVIMWLGHEERQLW